MCDLTVWDECTIDNTLQDLKGIKKPMAGDFCQILPVVSYGTPAYEINACMKASYLWNQVSKLSLTTNMRI